MHSEKSALLAEDFNKIAEKHIP